MATAKRPKLLPNNLPGIRKHFDTRIKEVKKRLHTTNKTRIALENELEVLEDGRDWCERVYDAGKAGHGTVKKKE